MLLHESMNNAIMHGNKLDRSKKVSIRLRHNDKRLILSVTDEGPGFCWKKLANKIPEVTSTSGRGFPIFTLYANRIRFNPAGNQVILAKII
jgi:serine/threonine-protein kinase RsbW